MPISSYSVWFSCRLTKNRFYKWLEALGLDPNIEKLSYNKHICNAHFDPEDITITPRGIIVLKHEAIPKRNLGPNIDMRKSLLAKEKTLKTM